LGAVLTAVAASAQQPAAKAPKVAVPESVAFEIDEAAERFNKAVGDGLAQRLEELRTILKDASARVRTALDRAQREQTEEANQAYEMVISGELLHVQTALQGIVNERTSVFDAQRELTRRLERVRTTLTKDAATYAREAKERQAEVAQLSAQLDILVDKHRAVIDAGSELPAEEDLRVRALADRLRLAEQDAKLTARAADESANRVGKLRDFDGRLSTASGEFALLFDRATGQIGLLGRVADMRRKGIEVASVITQLNRVNQQMVAVDAVLQDTSSTLDDLLSAPTMMADASAAPMAPEAPRRTGLEILKQVLQRRQAAAGGR
jgi:hypothetical protein